MRARYVITALTFFMICGATVCGSAYGKEAGTANADYLVDGLMYRGEGNCEEAIKSYQMARKLKQFEKDWVYDLAVVDCLVGLKRLDEAIDAYTKIIEGSTNRALQAQMYRGRAQAYYLKAVHPDSIDPGMLALARKDIASAGDLGADVSDLEKIMKEDTETKPVKATSEEINSVAGKPVTIIENPGKMIIGPGEYVLYISRDTIITDKTGTVIEASEIRPGDVIDFTCAMSYRNKADGMTHISAKTVTLHREVAPAPKPEAEEMKEKAPLPDATELLIISKLNAISNELKELNQKLTPPKPPAEAKTKKKIHKRTTPAAKGKEQPKKTEMQGEIK